MRPIINDRVRWIHNLSHRGEVVQILGKICKVRWDRGGETYLHKDDLMAESAIQA